MTSLRLAEAFIRTAVPEGHEPLRDLAELRAHMDGTHQLGVAGMLPLHVLMHMHEKEHAEPQWHGSPDSSRSSEFTARRKTVGSDSDWYHRTKRVVDGLESLRRSGFQQANQLESGHYLYFAAPGAHPHTGDPHEWQLWVHHASEADQPEQRMIYGRLGPDDSAIGEQAMRHLRNPHLMRSMHEQMGPGPLDETWPRRF